MHTHTGTYLYTHLLYTCTYADYNTSHLAVTCVKFFKGAVMSAEILMPLYARFYANVIYENPFNNLSDE
ncbi:hypothetical protein T12_17132 [Trichinella patagoniensis]|uniref:Uncharacterized protein n=1 Tax=Trichinella patagoniensis TaxID=990121 RepID=A0A0V0ZNE4_9BILA|nr:hypothetical protein T12_17132 [Trichinella patagoniensis]